MVVTVLDPDRGTLEATWPAREAEGHDWLVYQAAVSGDERDLFISYHGVNTTGIDRFTVDWGDGTAPETLPGDPIPCRAVVPYAWPTGDYVSVPVSTPGATSPLHHYDNPGTYTVTVTARSTACDGSQPQEATGTRGWSVP